MPSPVRFALTLLIVSAVLIAISLVASQAQPLPQGCEKKETVMNFLLRQHHEVPLFTGPITNGPVVVVTISPTNTWTLLFCDPNVCCIRGAGAGASMLKGA
jgi:hypothetical protein